MTEIRHLTEHQISASVDGVLQGASQEQVLRHLADCDECRGRYDELVAHHQMLATLLAHEADDAFFAALEDDVDRAMHLGDARAVGAVVSVRSGPSKPAAGNLPRPTLEAALDAIGPKPSWAPVDAIAPHEPTSAAPPAPAPAAPAPARSASPPAPLPFPGPKSARRLEPPPADDGPEPLHVFPDDEALARADAEVAELEAAEQRAREARARTMSILSLALGAVAVIAVATIAVMLLRRGNDARPAAEVSNTAATTMPAAPALPAPDPVAVAPAASAPVAADPIVPPARLAAEPGPSSRVPTEHPAEPAATRPAPATPAPVERRAKPEPPAAVPVVAKPAPASASPAAPARPASGPVRMCGVVRDANGNPVARAQVLVSGLTLGALTDASGAFCLTLPPGEHELRVSALGFAAGVEPVVTRPGMGEVAIALRPADAP